MPKREDLTGKQFGLLKVIECDEEATKLKGRGCWIVECQCENKTRKTVLAQNLKNNSTISCGCQQKAKKLNKYNTQDNVLIGYTSNTNQPFYIDVEDYDKIKDYTWREDCGYIATTTERPEKKKLYLHQLIMGFTDGNLVVDHKDRKPFNNRKSNLRIATHSENAINAKISKANTSGYKGVYFDKDLNKWRAEIFKDGQKINLDSFTDKELAHIARLEAETKYFEQFD